MTDTAILEISRWQREHVEAEAAEIRDTIEAYEYLARFEAEQAQPDNHADHMDYVRREMEMVGWRMSKAERRYG